MPVPYSLDLRKRVVAALEEGSLTRSEIAQRYDVGESTMYEWLQRWRANGSVTPKPHTGGPASGLDTVLLHELVEAQNDATLAEYAAAYAERTGRRYSISRICRGLKAVRLQRKKNAASQRAAQGRDRGRAGGVPG
jgi:transposase